MVKLKATKTNGTWKPRGSWKTAKQRFYALAVTFRTIIFMRKKVKNRNVTCDRGNDLNANSAKKNFKRWKSNL